MQPQPPLPLAPGSQGVVAAAGQGTVDQEVRWRVVAGTGPVAGKVAVQGPAGVEEDPQDEDPEPS